MRFLVLYQENGLVFIPKNCSSIPWRCDLGKGDRPNKKKSGVMKSSVSKHDFFPFREKAIALTNSIECHGIPWIKILLILSKDLVRFRHL